MEAHTRTEEEIKKGEQYEALRRTQYQASRRACFGGADWRLGSVQARRRSGHAPATRGWRLRRTGLKCRATGIPEPSQHLIISSSS